MTNNKLPDDDTPSWDDIEALQCPRCGSEDIEYDGEVYDDDAHRCSGFKCHECGYHFDELGLIEDEN